MVNKNTLGIIFPNTYDDLIPELVHRRTMASVPFGGRYRMIDFTLSAMVNAGIDNVTVLAKKNYYSLMDHLGNGREWDLSRKLGGLNMVPPFAQSNTKMYHGRVEAIASILSYLEAQKEKYVILSDCNIASDVDYADLMNKHITAGADVTMVYERAAIPEALQTDNYTFDFDENGRMTQLRCNDYRTGVQNLSMNVIVMGREELIAMVRDATVRNYVYLERDILAPALKLLNVRGYEYTGYRARIYNMKSYFDENMRLLDHRNMEALFPPERPVYTKVRDDMPARYIGEPNVQGSLIANGSIIEGTVINSVLFRGVRVAKGATVRNCVIMQDAQIQEGAEIDHCILDKQAIIRRNGRLIGPEAYPIVIAKDVVI